MVTPPKCRFCGIEYIPNGRDQRICMAEACRHKANAERVKAHRERVKARKQADATP